MGTGDLSLPFTKLVSQVLSLSVLSRFKHLQAQVSTDLLHEALLEKYTYHTPGMVIAFPRAFPA